MHILVIHQNYPGQFGNLSRALSKDCIVVAMGAGERSNARIPGIHYRAHAGRLPPPVQSSGTTHIEAAIRFGRSAEHCLRKLKEAGFSPDFVLAHPGWGEALFLRDVFPRASFAAYMEYFYRSSGSDIDFDPESRLSQEMLRYVRFRNFPSTMAFEEADLAITPTEWQRSTFPEAMRPQLLTLHDGIDTVTATPNGSARIKLPNGRTLDRTDEVITYVARSLEPYRGFHVLIRALPELQQQRPNAHVVIVGGDEVSYGASAGPQTTWRERLLREVGDRIELSQVHFAGRLAYDSYLALLQVSRVHLYLTYPFVLSWSLLEAMSAGCAVVASDTGPVQEVISDGDNGRLFPFFDGRRLVELVAELLDDPPQRTRLGTAARETIIDRYDFQARILPRYRSIIHELISQCAID